MKKWYDEEYEWTIEVIGYLRGDKTEGLSETAKKSATFINARTAAP